MSWALIALVAGLSFQLACVYDAMNWGLTYFTAPSAVLPFAVGAVLYFLRRHGRWIATPLAAGCAFAGWLANMLAGGTVFPASYIFGWGYLLDTVCFAIVVSGLSGLSSQQFGPLVERIDRMLGEWSYFAFLVHWLAGFLVAGILLRRRNARLDPASCGHAGGAGRKRRFCDGSTGNSWSRCAAGCAVLMEDRRRRRLSRHQPADASQRLVVPSCRVRAGCRLDMPAPVTPLRERCVLR